jgi:hypothetical protein
MRRCAMVMRKVYDTVNKVGGAWMNINQGFYNSPAKAAREDAQAAHGTVEARLLLEEVVADWPEGAPDTARRYLRQATS